MANVPSPLGGGKFTPYVKAIIEAEKAPIRQIERRKGKENDRLKLLQDFTGKVRKMRESIQQMNDFRKFREMKSNIGENGNLLGVTIDKNVAEVGEYQIEIQQLAGRHSMISNGFGSPDDEIGVGYLWYTLPNGETKSIYFNKGDTTVSDLVKAVNNEPELGLQAVLVNDGTGDDAPWRIIMSGKKTGMDQEISYPDFYFVDGDVRFSIDDERAAQSAIVKLNGFEILTPSNKVADLLPGVTLDLKQAKEGYEFTLSITEDIEKISGKVSELLNNINAVLDFINKQNQLDERSDTSRTLGGDGMLRSIESQIRSLIVRPIYVGSEDNGKWLRASDLGIQFQRNGQLTFNQDKFSKLLSADYDLVSGFFTGARGLANQLTSIADGLVGPGGTLVDRERGFRDRMRNMDDQIARKEDQIARKEDMLKAKFANLEAMTQQLQGQQAYMMQAIGAAAAGGGGIG